MIGKGRMMIQVSIAELGRVRAQIVTHMMKLMFLLMPRAWEKRRAQMIIRRRRVIGKGRRMIQVSIAELGRVRAQIVTHMMKLMFLLMPRAQEKRRAQMIIWRRRVIGKGRRSIQVRIAEFGRV